MLKLRKEKANLMGFKSHADYVLDDTMAKKTSRVDDLLQQIWKPGIARAKSEADEMQSLIKQEGGSIHCFN